MSASGHLPPDAISQFDQWAASVFDHSSLGMIRVSLDYKVMACNRTAAGICGLPTLEGKFIRDLLADQNGMLELEQQAEQRKQGLSTEYDIDVFHFPDRTRVPVRVSGMPVISPTGEIVGSFAIIRSLELEHRIRTFEEAIHTARDAAQIFTAVCEQTRPILDFDFSRLSIYSKTGKHSRMLFSYDPERRVEYPTRWYPISAALAEWTQGQEVQSIELTEFIRRFPELGNDPVTKAFLDSGYVKFLRYPVVRGGRVVASFTCASRKITAFSEAGLQFVKALPIAKAFLMALHFMEHGELSFRFNLIRDMFICRTPEAIAEVAVNSLARQYGWESVEIYWIEEASRRIRLLRQAAGPGYCLPESYSQPASKGILGYVYQNDRDVRIDEVTKDPQFRELYVPLGRATRSELCMPIRVNGRIAALLNVEDKQENAFSEEEQENLRSLLDEIGGLFGAVWDKALIASSFESTPSAVLIADVARNVVQHNPAAVSLLGFSAAELTGSPVETYFAQPEIVDRLFQAPAVIGIETTLRRKDGGVVPVLVGSRELEGFGSWVISARDLSNQKRIAELEGVREIYREVAAQTKVPLSLAYCWLDRLRAKHEMPGGESAAILKKALAQLKKVDITYERLALYSQDREADACKEMLLNAGDLVRRTLDNFPQEMLSVKGLDRSNLYVRGDPFEFEFAIESTISYLERFLPADDAIEVDVSSAAGRLLVQIQGSFPPEPDCCRQNEPAPEAICQAIREMALGAEIIGKFMRRRGGSFRQGRVEEGAMRFQLDFPLVHVEV